MTEHQIRRATVADAEELAQVYRSAYRENRQLGFPAKAGSASADDVEEWIRENRVYVATIENDGDEFEDDGTEVEEEVATDEGKIVGGVRLETTDPDRVKLSRLGVHENWKGEGVGSSLLNHAEQAVQDDGYATIWLTTPEEHPYLPELYRRRGYEKTGDYPLEFREYDEIVMEKRLG